MVGSYGEGEVYTKTVAVSGGEQVGCCGKDVVVKKRRDSGIGNIDAAFVSRGLSDRPPC